MPVRHHFPRWIICFYFPMETTLGMGPTAVIPGTPYYTTNGQDATGCEVVGNWSDDRLERVLPNPGSHRTEQDLDARDARLNLGISTGLGDEFEEKKLLVPAGTLAVLHFDLFHRGTINNAMDGRQRHMWKQYFLRTEDPAGTTPSWTHSSCRWRPTLDAPLLPEHSLAPVWLSQWERQLGAAAQTLVASVELDVEWSRLDEIGVELGRLLGRLGMHGPPWVASTDCTWHAV